MAYINKCCIFMSFRAKEIAIKTPPIMRTYIKGGVKMKKLNEIFGKNNEEVVKMKNWSLKKKLLVGGGIVSGFVLGAIAYGKNHGNDFEANECYDDEDEDEDFTEENLVSDEIEVEVEEAQI